MLARRITRTTTVPALRATTAREAAFAAWDESPNQDRYAMHAALGQTELYLRRVLPGEGFGLGKLLGEGSWGRVYAVEGSDQVVKVTLDPYEAGFARFVQNFRSGSPAYPHVSGVYKTAFGTHLIFREGLAPRESLALPKDVIAAADAALFRRLRTDLDVRHMDLHPGNILYRQRGGTLEAVVGDLGLTAYPVPSSIAEVNPKRNPMALYPKPSSADRVAVILAGFDAALSGVAAQALRAELPESAAELEASWPDSTDLVVRLPGRKKRVERVVIPVLVPSVRGLVPRSQRRELLAEAREALSYYVDATAKRGQTIEVYVHTLGADMGADLEDVTNDIEEILADFAPVVVPVTRTVVTPSAKRDQMIAKIETALDDGDRAAAVRLLKSLKRSLYAEAKRSR